MKLVRSISHSQARYLTFDDGPDPENTPAVLDILAQADLKATFFLIANRARQHPALVSRIISEGHAVGNHSLDHRYRNFFRRKNSVMKWMLESEDQIAQLTGNKTVGFRPPSGIITPEVWKASHETSLPLVLWNQRFFDAVFQWTETKALTSLERVSKGSIILLHDRQKKVRVPLFLRALDAYANRIKELKLEFAPLSFEMCKKESL